MIFRGIKIIEKFTSLVMTLKVGINGFGRIGRASFKTINENAKRWKKYRCGWNK